MGQACVLAGVDENVSVCTTRVPAHDTCRTVYSPWKFDGGVVMLRVGSRLHRRRVESPARHNTLSSVVPFYVGASRFAKCECVSCWRMCHHVVLCR